VWLWRFGAPPAVLLMLGKRMTKGCRNHQLCQTLIAEARKMLEANKKDEARKLLVKAERRATQETDKEMLQRMIKGMGL
jgi:hypothetical protein